MADIVVKQVYLKRLKVPYPPKGHFVAETQEIMNFWANHLKNSPLSEPRENRGKQRPVMLLDPDQLQYIVASGESVEFYDIDTQKFVGAVYEGVVLNEEELKYLDSTATMYNNLVGTTGRVSSSERMYLRTKADFKQANDPGFIATVGYTSGNRKARALNWSKNVKGAKVDKKAVAYQISSAFAHTWSALKRVQPDVVTKDFDGGSKNCMKGLKMDGGLRFGEGGKLRYSMVLNEEEVVFETDDLAPPAGLTALNYQR